MKTEKILLPIDTRKCPLEILSLTNGLAARTQSAVTLLHVVTLNILAPETRIYDELAAETRFYLECLAQEYLRAATSTSIRVRFGKLSEELIKQSREEPTDLIVLQNDGSSLLRRLTGIWKRSFNPMLSPPVEKVVREANCGVLVVSGKGNLDCEVTWGTPRRPRTARASAPIQIWGANKRPISLARFQLNFS
jgi:nucleotide-binding universal stress UspA family protein